MRLCLDLGNTRLKWGVFDEVGNLLESGAMLHQDIKPQPAWGKACRAHLVSVSKDLVTQKVIDALQQIQIPLQQIDSGISACGVQNGYAPGQLGADRWAAAIGAWKLFGETCVIVNAGSAITIDALVAKGQYAEYLGGLIMPGLQMMQNALLSNTAKVRMDIGVSGSIDSIPNNTSDAVMIGAHYAIRGAIHQMLHKLHAQTLQAPLCVITGGDATAMVEALRTSTRTVVNKQVIADNLVLSGVWAIAEESIAT